MADEETLTVEEQKKKSPLMLIIAVVVVLLLAGAGAFFFMSGDDNSSESAETTESASSSEQAAPMKQEMASYVPLPRPFLFNLTGTKKAVLVQIKVQLQVRGADVESNVKKHIPLIESALLSTFSGASVQKLSTQSGKDELRQQALLSVQNALMPIMGKHGVEKVLFVGFVMQ
ncbi:flagellar basal body-associated protein FliL [Parashewanella curva]|uniref:Flagellar protein FliL n=1 Tax=Parashewanella curva TaxID=2338552 RepID=A0A3L8Q1W3_9GAMM|nr:flagellar basal body-associated protein FliL [Parashewanella curva]RLV61631.1 flagellar basal body-associated protein FliL [Parashewanella curva]